MIVLAVDERRVSVSRVALHALPHVQHRAARRVDHHAASLTESREVGDRHPERRQDHHVVRIHDAEIERCLRGIRVVLEEDHAGIAQPGIDVRIVDDLAGEIDLPVGKFLARLVGVLDRALDPVAEAKLAGQANRHAAGTEREVPLLEQIDQPPVVRGSQLALDVSLEAESLSEIRWRCGGRGHASNLAGERPSNDCSKAVIDARAPSFPLSRE